MLLNVHNMPSFCVGPLPVAVTRVLYQLTTTKRTKTCIKVRISITRKLKRIAKREFEECLVNCRVLDKREA